MSSGAEYLLGRNGEESDRLNDQHRTWLKILGYLVHPTALESLPPAPRIADVATGTGVWGLDAARRLPKSTVTAFDISPKQFPTPESNPANITFHVHDAREPWPAEHQGQYDMVHIRAIVAGLSVSDWPLVATNLAKLLKPGGILQWAEGNLGHTQVLRNSDDNAIYEHLPGLLARWKSVLGIRDLTAVFRLPDLLPAAGLQLLTTDVVASDRLPDMRQHVTRNYCVAMLAWVKNDGVGPDEDVEQLAERVALEITAGAYTRTDTYIFIARRPLMSAE